MIGKLLIYAALATIACKLLTGKWPWAFFGPASTNAQARDRARKLLAVRRDASHDEIIEAHRQLITMVHPDRGGTNDQVHEANAARDLLLADLPDGR